MAYWQSSSGEIAPDELLRADAKHQLYKIASIFFKPLMD